MAEDELLQDLLIFEVTPRRISREISVDLYGGKNCVCGTVRFRFPKLGDYEASLRVLKEWASTGALVTMVTRGDTISLLSEKELLKRCLDDGMYEGT